MEKERWVLFCSLLEDIVHMDKPTWKYKRRELENRLEEHGGMDEFREIVSWFDDEF
jgi:hypothetical protein